MIIVELPIVYDLNYKETEKAKESGVEIEPVEIISMTTFIIPNDCLVRINEATNKERTTIFFNSDSYKVDTNYETTLAIIKQEIKKKEIY